MDASQVREVEQAMAAMRKLAELDPYCSDEPGRDPGIRPHSGCYPVDQGDDERALPEPDYLQAAVAGQCHRLLPDRCDPSCGLNEAIPIVLWLRQPTRNLIQDRF